MNALRYWLVLPCMAVVLSLISMAAAAHHGWAWAENRQENMTGEITEVYVGPPHPRLKIMTDDGPWQVDLGNPRQTEQAGFTEMSASVGDTIVVRGHRSRNADEKLIKAVRITVDDTEYTFYPGRVVEN